MGPQNILVADSSQDYLLALSYALQCRFRVFACQNGLQAVELLRSQRIHLLILDLSLPELDRLRLFSPGASAPMALATSRLHCSALPPCVRHFDFRGVIRKPASAAAVAAEAERLLSQASQGPDPRLVQRLTSLSVPEGLDGWKCLLVMIPSYFRDPGQSFTKELYPEAGKRFHRSGAAADRDVRYALRQAWDQGDPLIWQHYFPGAVKCPSNSEFIRRMAEELENIEE